MKNTNDTIGKRTCYLPVCGAVPQSTMPPHTGETASLIICSNLFNQRYQPSEVFQ